MLVIGFPLPNPQIDNYTFLRAPSFYDYDAVVVEMGAVSKVVEEVLTRSEDHRTYSDELILNEPTGPFVTGLADHLKRRREEAEKLLAAGKTLIVFARPNVPHSHILGAPGWDRYTWLPAPPDVSYRPPHLVPAEGRGVAFIDRAHPLSELVERFQSWFTYRAAFSDRLPAFPEHGRVLMRSLGGVPIGIELQAGGGRIVFLPALEDVPSGDMRFELATKLVDAVRHTIAGESEADAPAWALERTLPGLDEAETKLRAAEAAAATAQGEVETARALTAGLSGLRRLLWAEGRYSLDVAVREGLRYLDFSLETDVDRDGILFDGNRTALFEVQGDRGTVDEAVYIRVQRRLEKDLFTTAQPKKGIVIVNGKRRSAPDRRQEAYTNALRVACENYRYALLTGPTLFDMVKIALTTLDHTVKQRLRDAIWEAEGVVEIPADLRRNYLDTPSVLADDEQPAEAESTT